MWSNSNAQLARPPAQLVKAWVRCSNPGDAQALYDELRGYGRVVELPWGGALVLSHRGVQQAFTDERLLLPDATWRDEETPDWRRSFATVAMCDSTIQQNPPLHTASRRPLSAGLTARRVRELYGMIGDVAQRLSADLVGRLRRGEQVDLVGDFSRLLASETAARMIGLPVADAARLGLLAQQIIAVGDIARRPSEMSQADRSAVELKSYLEAKLSEDHEFEPGSLLHQWGGRPREEVLMNCYTLIEAGITTSSALLSSALFEVLTRDATPIERLSSDAGYRTAFADEVLRWDPPVKLVSRYAARPTEIDGSPIAQGQFVHIGVGAGSRDSEKFSTPGVFVPERKSEKSLAFGFGMHHCVGASLAKVQFDAGMRSISPHVPHMRQAQDVIRKPGPTFTDIISLKVRTGAQHAEK
ncbi:cytochrome P450 [Lentzea flaviverrucosa]|uniref:Cytochrome P450 n=1 Tax=Lentzea flaviverrucosa TaxID=200379 RepID=A0A1H9BI85_9PSEU|nr:cytochrome P450 [Lentzea flaviverrucosa]SEP88441.1 Cytochrome P450 [Lentzea flaviverrucosa]